LRARSSMVATRYTLVFVFLMGISVSAIAVADDVAAASAMFDKGAAYVREGDFDAALAAFETSYELAPNLTVLYNIGMCQKAVAQYSESLVTFRDYLKKGEGAIPEEKRQNVEQAIADITANRVGTLTLSSVPSGALLIIDEASVGEIPLPAPVMLNPGQHTIQISTVGFETVTVEVRINAGEVKALDVSMKPLTGVLRIACDPAGALVTIDGDPVGRCPVETIKPVGEYTVSVTAAGMQTVAKQAIVSRGETRLTIVLAPWPLNRSATPAADAAQTSKLLPLLGIGGLTLGGVLVGAGAYFNIRAYKDEKESRAVVGRMEDGAYENEKAYLDAYNRTADSLNRHQPLMIAGYAAGAALMIAGGVLLFIYSRKEHRLENGLAVAACPGVCVRF
jgi:tetratricopeptide (TPR) repeat protein